MQRYGNNEREKLISPNYTQMIPSKAEKNMTNQEFLSNICNLDNIIDSETFERKKNIKDQNGNTILHLFIINSNDENYLINLINRYPGVEEYINHINDKKQTPLHLICKNQYYETYKLIKNKLKGEYNEYNDDLIDIFNSVNKEKIKHNTIHNKKSNIKIKYDICDIKSCTPLSYLVLGINIDVDNNDKLKKIKNYKKDFNNNRNNSNDNFNLIINLINDNEQFAYNCDFFNYIFNIRTDIIGNNNIHSNIINNNFTTRYINNIFFTEYINDINAEKNNIINRIINNTFLDLNKLNYFIDIEKDNKYIIKDIEQNKYYYVLCSYILKSIFNDEIKYDFNKKILICIIFDLCRGKNNIFHNPSVYYILNECNSNEILKDKDKNLKNLFVIIDDNTIFFDNNKIDVLKNNIENNIFTNKAPSKEEYKLFIHFVKALLFLNNEKLYNLLNSSLTNNYRHDLFVCRNYLLYYFYFKKSNNNFINYINNDDQIIIKSDFLINNDPNTKNTKPINDIKNNYKQLIILFKILDIFYNHSKKSSNYKDNMCEKITNFKYYLLRNSNSGNNGDEGKDDIHKNGIHDILGSRNIPIDNILDTNDINNNKNFNYNNFKTYIMPFINDKPELISIINIEDRFNDDDFILIYNKINIIKKIKDFIIINNNKLVFNTTFENLKEESTFDNSKNIDIIKEQFIIKMLLFYYNLYTYIKNTTELCNRDNYIFTNNLDWKIVIDNDIKFDQYYLKNFLLDESKYKNNKYDQNDIYENIESLIEIKKDGKEYNEKYSNIIKEIQYKYKGIINTYQTKINNLFLNNFNNK